MSKSLTFVMVKDKETKGAVRYSEQTDSGKNIYFRKDELQKEFGAFPASLTVTVNPS